MKTSAFKRIWAFFLAVLMVAGTVPVYVFADDADPPLAISGEGYDEGLEPPGVNPGPALDESGTIILFHRLPAETLGQSAPLGTPLSELNLPEHLSVTLFDVAEGEVRDDVVGVQQWDSTPVYDPLEIGTYHFTPVIIADSRRVSEDADLPVISVEVFDDQTDGSVLLRLVVERPAFFSAPPPPGGLSSHGEGLGPYAKELYDILTGLQPGDKSPHSIGLVESYPSMAVPLGLSREVLDAAAKVLAETQVLDHVIQPAFTAYWHDNPYLLWLMPTLTLEASYTAKTKELTLDKLAFVFDYVSVTPFNGTNDDVEVYCNGSSIPETITASGITVTLTDAVNYINSNLSASADIRILLLKDVAGAPLATLNKAVRVDGGSVQCALSFNSATVTCTSPIAFENLTLNGSTGQLRITSPEIRLSGIDVASGITSIALDGATVYAGDVTARLSFTSATKSLTLTAGAVTITETSTVYQFNNMTFENNAELTVTSNTTKFYIKDDLTSNGGTIIYAGSQFMVVDPSYFLLWLGNNANSNPTFGGTGLTLQFEKPLPANQSVMLMEGCTEAILSNLNNWINLKIKNVTPPPDYDEEYVLKEKSRPVPTRSTLMAYKSQVRVSAKLGSEINTDHDTFQDAVTKANGYTSDYEVTIKLRNNLDETTGDNTHIYPTREVSIVSDPDVLPINGNVPFELKTSSSAIQMKDNLRFQDITVTSTVSGGATLTDSGPHTLTIDSGVDLTGINLRGLSSGGSNLMVNAATKFASADQYDDITVNSFSGGAVSAGLVRGGNVTLVKGDLTTISATGNIVATVGAVEVKAGAMSAGGNITAAINILMSAATAADEMTATGTITAQSGSVTMTNGQMKAGTSIAATTGSVTMTNGQMTATNGSITAHDRVNMTAGVMSARTGITAATGEVTMNAGSMSTTFGNISAGTYVHMSTSQTSDSMSAGGSIIAATGAVTMAQGTLNAANVTAATNVTVNGTTTVGTAITATNVLMQGGTMAVQDITATNSVTMDNGTLTATGTITSQNVISGTAAVDDKMTADTYSVTDTILVKRGGLAARTSADTPTLILRSDTKADITQLLNNTTLTMNAGAALTTKNPVRTNTFTAASGVSLENTGTTAATPLLSFDFTAQNSGITTPLTVKVTDSTAWCVNGKVIVEARNQPLSSKYNTSTDFTLVGFTGYMLFPEPQLSGTDQQYYLCLVKASVHNGDSDTTGKPFPDFNRAAVYVTNTNAPNQIIKLHANTATNDVAGMPTPIGGYSTKITSATSGPYTLTYPDADFVTAGSVEFDTIKLATQNPAAWDFQAAKNLAFGSAVQFEASSGPDAINLIGQSVGELSFGAGAYTFHFVTGFGTVALQSSATNVGLHYVEGFTHLAGNGGSFTFLSKQTNGNITLPNNVSAANFTGTITLDQAYSSSTPLVILDKIIQTQKGTAEPAGIVPDHVMLGTTYSPYRLDWSAGAPADTHSYYILGATVNEIQMNYMSPATGTTTTITYGDDVYIEGSLWYNDGSNAVACNHTTGEEVFFFLEDQSNLGVEIPVTAQSGYGIVGTPETSGGSLAANAFCFKIQKPDAGTYNVIAKFTDQGILTSSENNPVAMTLTVNPRPISITANSITQVGNAVTGRSYNGNTTPVDFNNDYSALVTLGAVAGDPNSGPLPSESAAMYAALSGTLVYNTKDAGNSKIVVLSALSFTDPKLNQNYSYLTSNINITTNAEITKVSLIAQAQFQERDYDGTTNVTTVGTPTVGPLLGSDTAAGNYTHPTFSLQSPNASNSQVVKGSAVWTLGSNLSTNYYLENNDPTFTVKINKKTLYAADIQITDPVRNFTKQYDGSTDYPITSGGNTLEVKGHGVLDSPGTYSISMTVNQATFNNANAGSRALSVSFTLSDTNYQLATDVSPRTVNGGTITKANAKTMPDHTKELLYTLTPGNYSLNLASLLVPEFNGTAQPGMNPGALSYTISSETGALFSTTATVNGSTNELEYQTLAYTTANVGQTHTVTLTVTSENYAISNTPAVIFEIVDKYNVTINVSGHITVAGDNKVYDGLPVAAQGSAQVTLGGVPVTDAMLEYVYQRTDMFAASTSTPPKDAGTYTLTVQVQSNDTQYAGSSVPLSFTIQKRPLTIAPLDRQITLGDATPTWTALSDFNILNLAPGETLPTIGMNPATLSVQPITVAASGVYSVLLSANNYTANNYIISKAVGNLNVKPFIPGGPGSGNDFLFVPPNPDGDNGWYRTDIRVTSTGGGPFTLVGTSPAGPFYSSLDLNQETAQGDSVTLYLATAGIPQLVSEPRPFTYWLDHTPPVLRLPGYTQIKNHLQGVLSVEARDTYSGLAGQKITAQLGGNLLELDSDGNGRYAGLVDTTGTYTIATEDRAGNPQTINYNVLIRSILDIEVRKETEVLSALRVNIDGGAVQLNAVTTAGSTAIPGQDFDFQWDVSTPGVLSLDQNGLLTPRSIGRTTISVSALGVAKHVIVEVVRETNPYPENPDLILIIEPMREPDRAYMLDYLNKMPKYLYSGFFKNPNWANETSMWLEIHLVDRSQGYIEVPLPSPITINLPYPDNSLGADDGYALFHKLHDKVTKEHTTRAESGVEFTVDELSPFTMLWVNGPLESGVVTIPGNTTTSASRGGGRGSDVRPSYLYDDFWHEVITSIKSAAPGSIVKARAPAYITTCPTDVLYWLSGRNIYLVITWAGDPIVLYGKDIEKPDEKVKLYFLYELAALFGMKNGINPVALTEYDLENPSTGGDFYEITVRGDALKPAVTAAEVAAIAPFLQLPEVRDTPPPAIISLKNGLDMAASETGGAGFNTFGLMALTLLAALLAYRYLTGKRSRTPAPAGVPVTARVRNTWSGIVKAVSTAYAASRAKAAAPGAGQMPAAQIPQAAAPAMPVVKPAVRTVQPAVRTSSVTKRTARSVANDSFFTVMEGHKKLQHQLQSGAITREEYETRKRKLLMYS